MTPGIKVNILRGCQLPISMTRFRLLSVKSNLSEIV